MPFTSLQVLLQRNFQGKIQFTWHVVFTIVKEDGEKTKRVYKTKYLVLKIKEAPNFVQSAKLKNQLITGRM